MKSKTEERNDVMIIKLSGKITIGEGDVQLRNVVNDVLSKDFKKIILDMKDISYMDSSGVGELVSSHTTIANQEGQLRLCNLRSKLYSLLQLTALVTVFQIYDSVEDALQSFS